MPRKAAGKAGQSRISDAFAVSKKSKSADLKKNIAIEQPVVRPVKVVEEKTVDTVQAKAPTKKDHLKPEKAEYKKVLKELTENEISNPIHQNGLSTAEKVLKQFDMRMEYGPTVGITRLDRWKRADRLGLDPPSAVRDILESAEGQEEPKYREAYTAEYL